jgi:hypothetical protein
VNRRVLGRGRTLATIGAVLTLIGCVLPWYTTSGAALPARSINAFEGAGILVFISAIVIIALVLLPYAAGDQPLSLDRTLSFAIVATLGVIGLVLKIVQQLGIGPIEGMFPDRAVGLWVSAAGLAIVAWGVTELASAKTER